MIEIFDKNGKRLQMGNVIESLLEEMTEKYIGKYSDSEIMIDESGINIITPISYEPHKIDCMLNLNELN